ncbi:MAG: hypothetical protein WD738_19095 [Pirellulales bacterium]
MSLPDYMISARMQRPLGIAILSVLHFIGGVGLVVLTVAFPIIASRKPEVAEGMAAIGLPLPLLVAGMLFIAVLAIGSAVGMWKGAKWGWYLGSFYYVYSIVRNLSAIVSVYLLFDQMPVEEVAAMQRGPEYHFWKFGLRTVVHALIFLYFFKENVLEYFGLRDVNRLKVVLIEFGICIGTAVAVSLWNLSTP